LSRHGTVLITGAGGFIGAAVAKRLLDDDPSRRIVLSDRAMHPRIEAFGDPVRFVEADLTRSGAFDRLLSDEIDTIFHFAALVSGGAEEHYELGFRINVLALIDLLETCREQGRSRRLVVPSSIAGFGGRHMPPVVDDFTFQHPQGSYGVAKVVGEQLINDYSRRGYVDGRCVRLAATIVRDDPHAGLSCATSALVREPVAGNDYVCPLPPDARMPVLSIARTVDMLVRLSDIAGDRLGDFRAINGPSLSPTLQQIVDAVAASGADGLGKVTFKPEPQATAIVNSWPKEMRHDRAAELGFEADANIEAIVNDYVAQRNRS